MSIVRIWWLAQFTVTDEAQLAATSLASPEQEIYRFSDFDYKNDLND